MEHKRKYKFQNLTYYSHDGVSGGICDDESKNGHLNVLQWLRSRDLPCSWDADTCTAAAQNGDLDMLVWLRSQKPRRYPWNHDACHAAASGGHLNMLIWLRSQKPPCYWMPGPMYLLQHKMEI